MPETNYKTVEVVINPAAGRPEPILNILNRVFREYEVDWDVSITQKFGDAAEAARRAAANGVDVVAAYGGDGTQMEVANGLIETGVSMMILPGGTNNVLAQEFDVPLQLESAVRQLFARVPKKTDVVRAHGKNFVLRAEMGLTAQMNEMTTRELKDQLGTLAYGVSSIRSLFNMQRSIYKLTIDDKEIEVEGVSCIVANTSKLGSGNLRFSHNVSPHDGILDVFIFNAEMRSLLTAAMSILDLDVSQTEDLIHHRGRYVKIETISEHSIWADGENFGVLPAEFEVLPGVLDLLLLPDVPMEI